MHLSDRIGRRLKLQDLNVFMTVVQTGSMLKAAERLNTDQPNISRSITELEHAVGVRLLDRHRRGVQPTAYGLALLDGGSVVFDGLRQAVKNIEFLADPTAGEVRIGCTPLLASSFVSAVVDRLSQRFPRIIFSLTTGYVETLHRALSDRNVDLLVTRRFGSLAADQRQDFECFLMICPSWQLARAVAGFGGDGSPLPTWSTNRGYSPLPKAGSDRSRWKRFARVRSIIPGRP
jgi:DNA-binding transcriptional LysR family regulator